MSLALPARGATVGRRADDRRAERGQRVGPAARTELLALTALVVMAAAVRWPYLWSIPLFTDETMESLKSFAIYQGRELPLTNVAGYLGALYNYLEAACFVLFGPTVYAPRLAAWLLGTAAVAATYLLAREMIGRPAAWLAAGLLATSGVHAGGNSHVAWSHCTTPLFLALTLLFLHRAVRHQSGRSLLGAGLVGGLTLQSHPTVIAFLPGMAIYLLWAGRGLLRTRWPYVAALFFLLGYGNMIVYNAMTGFKSIDAAQDRDSAYAEQRSDTYLAREGRILLTLIRLPAGAVDARDGTAEYLRDPAVLAYAGLALAGVVLLARAGNPLPGLVIVSALLIFPLFSARHDLLPRQGRYLAPLLPLIFIALAAAAWQLWSSTTRHLRHQTVATSLGVMAASLLVVLPLIPLQRYYEQSIATGQTNERFFRLLAEIEASRVDGEFVLLDYQLAQENLGGGGTALRTLNFMLTVRDIPHGDLTLEPARLARRYGAGGILLVMTEKTFDRIGSQLPLQPPPGRNELTRPAPYGVYRLGPSAAQNDATTATGHLGA